LHRIAPGKIIGINTVAVCDCGVIPISDCGAIRECGIICDWGPIRECGAIHKSSTVCVFGWGFLKDHCGIAATESYIFLRQPFYVIILPL
jgi:hypothetical protein